MERKFILLTLLLVISSRIAIAGDVKYFRDIDDIEYDTIAYMVNDPIFEESYTELNEMFLGNSKYCLKRAEYLVENAYDGGRINYSDFCQEIDSIVRVLNNFIDINGIRNYRTSPNFAIFTYFTTPSIMNGNRRFIYDFEDPMGKRDYRIFFTSTLIRTHKGQCTSMPLLYKILCDELGGQSALAFGPMHLYVKHIGEDGSWVNVELTHGGFVRDEWIMESLNVSTEAVKNGIFLTALSEKETIAFMIMQLARAYQNKYQSKDYFTERCVENVLNRFPNFCDALVLKFNLLQEQGIRFQAKYGNAKTPYLIDLYKNFREVMNKLELLGYSQPTLDEYNAKIKEATQMINTSR